MLDSKKYKTEGQIKVGRASDNDIVITDDQLPKKNINNISRLQFIIERKKDGTVDIQDKSSNGTFIDDLKIGRGNVCLILYSSIIASLADLLSQDPMPVKALSVIKKCCFQIKQLCINLEQLNIL